MSNIIKFDGFTKNDLSPNEILKEISKDQDIERVFVVTVRKDNEVTFHSSHADIYKNLYLCELFKHKLLTNEFY